jgi:hypothetical protein
LVLNGQREGNRMQKYIALVILVIIGFAGCASTELAYYDFGSQRISVDARVAPDARVDASYNIVVDPEDPVRTALSIGSSLAKANQVRQVEEKLFIALEDVDIRTLVEDELSDFVESSLGARVVEDRGRADLQLRVEIESYGVDASGSGVDFQMSAVATMWDVESSDRVWRGRESVSQPVSPSVFGLSGAADNVLSAVALSEVSEEDIAKGLERLARDAAWEIGLNLERDIYRARRRR